MDPVGIIKLIEIVCDDFNETTKNKRRIKKCSVVGDDDYNNKVDDDEE